MTGQQVVRNGAGGSGNRVLRRARAYSGLQLRRVKKGDAAAVKTLLAKKADVNAAAADSSTALDWAVHANNLAITNLLLGAGANVNGATRYNITPLALACKNGNAAMIERLLQGGRRPQRHVRGRPDRADDGRRATATWTRSKCC